MSTAWRTHSKACLETAVLAAQRWGIAPHTVALIAHSGNSVFRAVLDGNTAILRLTDASYRTADETLAELAFIEHLAACGVGVSRAIASSSNVLVENVARRDGLFCASLFEFAPGHDVAPGTAHWTDSFLREWGTSLARLHQASQSAPRLNRWQWCEEHLMASAHALLPASDTSLRYEFDAVTDRISQLPRDASSFGMTHSDYGPGNLHYCPGRGITTFDFGNCCYHWFMWDLAVGLRWLSSLPDAARLSACVLDGYQRVLPITPESMAYMPWFIRLRLLYIYLDRRIEYLRRRDEVSLAEMQLWRDQIDHRVA